MDPSIVKERLRSFIADQLLRGNAEGLDEQTPLLELGIVDSMGITELTSFIESEFKLVLTSQDLSALNFASIEALAKLVLRLAR